MKVSGAEQYKARERLGWPQEIFRRKSRLDRLSLTNYVTQISPNLLSLLRYL